MKTKTQRCPILRLLLPLIAGYAASEHLLPGVFRTGLAAGTAFAGAAAFLAIRRPEPRMAWTCCFSASVFCLALAYYNHRKGYLDPWGHLPPREAELVFKVERLFASPIEDRISGIGRIIESPPLVSELEDKRLHFSFPIDPETQPPARTARLRARGVLEPVDPESPQDSFYQYLLRSGVQFRFARGPPPEEVRPARAFFRFCRERRETFAGMLRGGALEDKPYVRVYVAMLLGKRQVLEPEQRSAFMETGTLHLFAISGLHIGVIAFALHTVLTILRVPPVPTAVFGLSILLLYVEITGGAPSAVRALIMVAFFWCASVLKRPGNPVSALACSAVCVLLLFPYQLWSAGFQLSYTVVASILLLGIPLADCWKERARPFAGLPRDELRWIHRTADSMLQFFLLTLAVSLTATLASSPLSIHYFNVFAPGAVLLNVVLVSLASLVISAGMLALLFGHMGLIPLTVLFNHAAWVVIVLMESAVAIWRFLPAHFWHAEYRTAAFSGATVVALLASLLLYSERGGRPEWINAVMPFLVFALLLLTGVRLTFPE